MLRLLTVTLVLVPALGLAQTIYTWTDETGTVHYTDNLSTVPQGVQVATTEGEALGQLEIERDERQAKPGEAAAVTVAQVMPARTGVLSASTGEELDELSWRAAFRAARGQVAALQDEIAIDQRRLADPSGLAINYTCGSHPYGYAPPPPAPPQAGLEVQVGVQPVPGLTITGSGKLSSGHPTPPPGRPMPQFVGGPCWVAPSPELDRVRQRLDRNLAALERAQGELDDLDRQASQHGVPRAWRR